MKKRILFICGSLNQTTMLHKISLYLSDCDCYFSPYYCSGFLKLLLKLGLLDFSILGGKLKANTDKYLAKHNLNVDYEGKTNDYDLVVTCSDLIIPKNIRNNKIVLVQEGMTDPMNFAYKLVKFLHLPRWASSTAATGQSDAYIAFCVASEGYKNFFITKGNCIPDKLIVTGIPNFDNCKEFLNNEFPYKNYVLICTSDGRETYKIERRKKFLKDVAKIAGEKQAIFKLHPNENTKRAAKEIKEILPEALIFANGNTNHMIANCDVLIVEYSSVIYIGLALGKDVHTFKFDMEELKKLTPIQNNGESAKNISEVCRKYL